MRAVVFAALGLGLSACDAGYDSWDEHGVLYASTRGVVILDDGAQAHAGMYGTTCEVDPTTGWVGADYDYPGDSESVQDVGTSLDDQDLVVVVTDTAVDTLVPHASGWEAMPEPDVRVRGVVQARLAAEGLVLLLPGDTGCDAWWTDRGARLGVTASCDGLDLAVDRDSDVAWVAGPQGVVRVEPGHDVLAVDDTADRVAWDATAGMLYVAQAGGGWVEGLLPDGSLAWHVDLPGEVVAIDDMGVAGSAAALVQTPTTADLYVIDGDRGDARLVGGGPAGVNDVVFGHDGRSFALVRDQEVRFRMLPE